MSTKSKGYHDKWQDIQTFDQKKRRMTSFIIVIWWYQVYCLELKLQFIDLLVIQFCFNVYICVSCCKFETFKCWFSYYLNFYNVYLYWIPSILQLKYVRANTAETWEKLRRLIQMQCHRCDKIVKNSAQSDKIFVTLHRFLTILSHLFLPRFSSICSDILELLRDSKMLELQYKNI